MKQPEIDEHAAAIERWEREIEEEVRSVNASSRTPPYVRMNWRDIRETAKSMGIDQERVERLILAADAGFRWDTAINILEQAGMHQEAAEDVAEALAHHIVAGRTMDDVPVEAVRERKELLWSVVGLALLAIGMAAWMLV